MAKCSIQLALDNSGSSYAPGELITGTVVVKVLEQCRCEQLTLTWQWRTHGLGDPEAGPVEHLLTLSGQEEWLAGQELHYTFRLVAPSGPLTYHGHIVSVDWRLRAELSLPGLLSMWHHMEVPFDLVLAKTEPLPAATGPEFWQPLEAKVPRKARGKLSGWHRRGTIWFRALGNLRIDPESVAPGGRAGLLIHLRPEQAVGEQDLSVSVECVELATNRRREDRRTTHEEIVYTKPFLTRTNRALRAGELLEFPVVMFAIPSDAPTGFTLKNNEVGWRLRFEWKFKGDKRTFVQLVPFQVDPPPMPRAAAPRHQGLQVVQPSPTRMAPWLPADKSREEQWRGPLPASEDVRRQLEGGLEVLEAAHTRYTALEKALQASKWKLHLRPRLETLREARRQESALVEALERLHHRARSEGWAGTEPALVLAHELEGLRARVGALASRQLGPPEDREAPLARWLERLERSVVQSLPAPLAPEEKLLCAGRFSPSLSVPGLLVLLGLSFTHCGINVGIRGEGGTLGSGFWGAWLVLTALCFWLQYRRSGRFWLTERRLIWLPTRGDPLQVSVHDIRPPSGYRYPKSVKVELMDGQTLQLAFISRSRRFADELKRQCQASPSREHPRGTAPPEPPTSAPG